MEASSADLAAKPRSTPLSAGQAPPPSRRSREIVNRAGPGDAGAAQRDRVRSDFT